jgi:hypothetical protein
MKLFFLGGLYKPDSSDDVVPSANVFRASMRELGQFLAGRGHDLVLCSPYEGSIDHEILKGVAASKHRPRVEMHFPETPENLKAVEELSADLKLPLQKFAHAADRTAAEQGKLYTWLLSQLSALDTAHVVIAAGGRPDGSANMLLHLAEARRFPILPFGHLGGAAARCFERQRYTLEDKLGPLRPWLLSPSPIDNVATVLERLSTPAHTDEKLPNQPSRFFISYARARVAEADLVETLLRRRELTVSRDDQAFDPSAELTQEIERAIRTSNVFVALWSSEYACSPWCHDEMTLALELRAAGKLDIWLLQLDETRVVPPGARKLISHPSKNRDDISSTLLKLLDFRPN